MRDERLVPARGQFAQAVAQVVFAQVQHQLAAFERRIVQEHRNQANQPVAAFFGFLQDVTLLVGQFAERAGQQQVVIALDHGQRRFQFMRGGRQEHGLLAVHFLQAQVGRQQIPIGDLPFLQQRLHRVLCGRGRFVAGVLFHVLDPDNQPVRVREPLNPRQSRAAASFEFHIELTLSAVDSLGNDGGIRAQHVGKQVQIRFGRKSERCEPLFPRDVGLEDPACPVGYQNGLFHQVD